MPPVRPIWLMSAVKISQLGKEWQKAVFTCNPIAITAVEVDLRPEPDKNAVYCRATVRCTGNTGVEMETLTAVQVALLTIYDMCKAVDRGMTMTDIGLLAKSGGKSGTWRRSA